MDIIVNRDKPVLVLKNQLLALDTNNRMKLSRPSAKLLASGSALVVENKYTLRDINKLLKVTTFRPVVDSRVKIEYSNDYVSMAGNREIIPVYFGVDCDAQNYKTLSFSIFTGANSDRTNSDYVFIFLSNEVDEGLIDDDIEDSHVFDSLNDLFGVCGGVDWSIVLTIKKESNLIGYL